MSRGSPIVPVRIPPDVLDLMEETILCRNANSPRPPWSRSSFIVDAIKEKVKKMARSRTWRKWSGQKAFKEQLAKRNSET